MSKYDLDDDLVRKVISGRTSADNQDLLFAQLEQQLPIPMPSKVGAVVRTDGSASEYTTWVLCQLPGLWFSPEDGGGNAYLPREIGRITEVLAPGVDL